MFYSVRIANLNIIPDFVPTKGTRINRWMLVPWYEWPTAIVMTVAWTAESDADFCYLAHVIFNLANSINPSSLKGWYQNQKDFLRIMFSKTLTTKLQKNLQYDLVWFWEFQGDKAEVVNLFISTPKGIHLRSILFQLNLLVKFGCVKFCLELVPSVYSLTEVVTSYSTL